MAPKNKGNTDQITLRIPHELKMRCEIFAAAEALSLNEWIRKALEAILLLESDEELKYTLEYLNTLKKDSLIQKLISKEYVLEMDIKNTQKCPVCNEDVPLTNDYCGKCGAKMPQIPPARLKIEGGKIIKLE